MGDRPALDPDVVWQTMLEVRRHMIGIVAAIERVLGTGEKATCPYCKQDFEIKRGKK